MKDWPPVTAPYNTRPCASLLLALLRWAGPRLGIKVCQSVWPAGDLHRRKGDSFWRCTNRTLCTFHWYWAFKSTVGKHIHTGTRTYMLLIHTLLGVCHTRSLTPTDIHRHVFIPVHLPLVDKNTNTTCSRLCSFVYVWNSCLWFVSTFVESRGQAMAHKCANVVKLASLVH